MELRDYQARAVAEVRAKWAAGAKHVLLVAPTASGKTEMAQAAVGKAPQCWLVHTRDLLDQTAKRLREATGQPVNVIAGGVEPTNGARIHVAMVQSLFGREVPEVNYLIPDECHHYRADEWELALYAFKTAKRLGLTATPARYDNRPLGDVFDELVVAAQIQDLVERGYLMKVDLLRAPEPLKGMAALDAVEAYMRYANGTKAFGYLPSVDMCQDAARRFRENGVSAKVIAYNTGDSERRKAMGEFAAGEVRVLLCHTTLTEGIDVPDAETCILGKSYHHVGQMMQATGRIMRTSPSKTRALVLDLVGCTHVLGHPQIPRLFSLTGEAISTPTTNPEAVGKERNPMQWSVGNIDLQEFEIVSVGAEVARVPSEVMKERWNDLLGLVKLRKMRRCEASAQFHAEYGLWPA